MESEDCAMDAMQTAASVFVRNCIVLFEHKKALKFGFAALILHHLAKEMCIRLRCCTTKQLSRKQLSDDDIDGSFSDMVE